VQQQPQAIYSAPIVTPQIPMDKQWKFGLFDCFGDCGICCKICCCAHCIIAQSKFDLDH